MIVPHRVHELLQEVIDRLEFRDSPNTTFNPSSFKYEIELIHEARRLMERWIEEEK